MFGLLEQDPLMYSLMPEGQPGSGVNDPAPVEVRAVVYDFQFSKPGTNYLISCYCLIPNLLYPAISKFNFHWFSFIFNNCITIRIFSNGVLKHIRKFFILIII